MLPLQLSKTTLDNPLLITLKINRIPTYYHWISTRTPSGLFSNPNK